ncbi:MAG: hypothetical protein CTY35_00110 [Methylotenera sp.]|uniref:hypothetical protein n=1 Tax=Methylotenera sp. TaxID=2051956 RepID=UPI000D4D8334|nr:hypothetical protein [Methylotenera sp.]PPC84759.1 MAG: hypothetical protein CTY38_00110 [Methylotenera sp.]PPD02118.1 MAG: hypothetical protein CTY35_00110 [Methylotenera sp.]
MSEVALRKTPEQIMADFDPVFIGELYTMIDALPQRKHLTKERIDRWLSAILSFEPERAKWHIKRLSGLGGSEIGTVAAPYMGEHDPFSTAKDIYFDKLMYTIPQAPNGHMKRGIFMEDHIRDAFQSLFGFKSRPEDMAKFADYRDPKHPWLVGNPDEYGTLANSFFMADYKCPMPDFQDKYDKDGVSFGYIAQLHHYTIIARNLKLPVDGLLLCSWDMKNWAPDVRSIELNEVLIDKILEAGDWLWNECILAGKMPTVEYGPRIALTDESHGKDAQLLKRLVEESSKLSVLANRAYAKDKEIKAEISNILERRRFGNAKVVYGITDITAKEELDMDKITALLARFDLSPNDFLEETGEYQPSLVLEEAVKNGVDLTTCKVKIPSVDAMVNALLERDIDREQFTSEKVSIALSRAKTGEVAEAVTGMKGEADVVITEFNTNLKGKYMPGRGLPPEIPDKAVKSKGPRM